jgi:F420-non-reducing hydrogenase iron-sulfur subunit
MVLRAFRSGADGVLVLGCHIGDCHYINGNHRTAKRMPLVRNLLSYVGVNPDRFRLDWVSSAEAPKFTQVTKEFVDTVRALGPLAEEMGEQ